MVQFILTDTTNETKSDAGGDNYSSVKKCFPVTPHPTKPRASRETKDDGDLPSEDERTHAGVLDVESPGVAMASSKDSGKQQGDDEGEKQEEQDDEWKRFVESAATPEDAPNLSAYLDAKSVREKAKEHSSIGLEDCINGLNEAMIHDMLQDSVVSLHREQAERFEAYEADIVLTMKSNHFRRKTFLKRTDDANEKWGKQYKRLRRTILHEPADTDDSNEKSGEECKHDDEGAEQSGDPDWQELAEFQPSRDNVRSFLEAREKLQNADEALSQALDEIHEGLKSEADAIVQIVVDFHYQRENACLALEDDIQFHLAENCKRRDGLQQALEDSAKQAQGVFAKLLSRLASSGK